MGSVLGPQALMVLGNRETQCDAEKERIKTARLPLYLNLSLTELRLESPHKALKYGNKALEIDSTNTKALFRCGQVRQRGGSCSLVPFLNHQLKIRGEGMLNVFFLYKTLPKKHKQDHTQEMFSPWRVLLSLL